MTVKVSTGGYGGQKIREDVRIHTNDNSEPSFDLTVTGFVEKFAEVRPERVSLVGPPGKALFAEVEIIPRKEYPFRIRELKAKNGAFIHYELTETCDRGRNRCVIRIENRKTDKGRFLDALYVETDSSLRPVIPIYITGLIR